MKPVSALVLLILALTACHRDPDAHLQQQIVGTWTTTCQYSNGPASTNTIAIGPDGRYECRITNAAGREFFLQGVFHVQQGFLVDTMTNSGSTNAPVPVTSRARVSRIDDHEMLLRYEPIEGAVYPTNEPIYRKVSR